LTYTDVGLTSCEWVAGSLDYHLGLVMDVAVVRR
jgi:hypothetical protein